MTAIRTRTRKEMQQIVRPQVLDVMKRLGRIDAQARGNVERRLLEEGVEGDVVDVTAAIRKLHFVGRLKFTHPIVQRPAENGGLYDERRHVLTFVY